MIFSRSYVRYIMIFLAFNQAIFIGFTYGSYDFRNGL